MLKDKIVYVIVTGATKTKSIMILLEMLKNYGAKSILMPTPNAIPFLEMEHIDDSIIIRSEPDNNKIPEEDIVIVAPCTFNTFSKISMGIADNYPTSILHTAIGKQKHIVVAPAMGIPYWHHPLIPQSRKIIVEFGIEIIWPEYIYSQNGQLEKITMAPWEKIFDCVCNRYQKIRYDHNHIEINTEEIDTIITANYPEFSILGKQLQENHYINATAGFLAKRIPEGILLTRSGSLLGNLSTNDLILINHHNNQVVQWISRHSFPPSSETPLALEIFNAFPDINVIIHGHCRDITYSAKMVKYHSKEYLRYGQWGELYKILAVLKNHHFGIMKLHGELVLAKNFKEAQNKYLEIYNKTL